MGGKVVICTLVFALSLGKIFAQQVEIPREKSGAVAPPIKRVAAQPIVEVNPLKVALVEPRKLTIEQMREAGAVAAEKVKEEDHDIEADASSADVPPPAPAPKTGIVATTVRPVDRKPHPSEPLLPPVQSFGFPSQSALTKLADGFDLPVGKPDARGYYKARGFKSHGHLGEDWDGVGGGDTDLGDPVYCIGDGVVVFARDCHQGWGNVIIVRHAFREGLGVRNVDSLYGHLNKILVRRGQQVKRGQQIAEIGNAHGLYDAHLHLEVRKNIAIGMSRDKFAQDLSNYYDPTTFIESHRRLQTNGGSYRVAMNTFTYDARINWDKLPNFSHAHSGGGSSESAYALKKALASQSTSAH